MSCPGAPDPRIPVQVVFLESTSAVDATLEGPTLPHLLELCQTVADTQLGQTFQSEPFGQHRNREKNLGKFCPFLWDCCFLVRIRRSL